MSTDTTTRAEQIVWLTEWASVNGATLQIKGEVGFGRPCTGILVDSHYVDTSDAKGANAYVEGGLWWEPEDSYHKHDCVCVLGHGDESLRQLYDWVRWLDKHGWKVETSYRRPESDIDLAVHGITLARLVRA